MNLPRILPRLRLRVTDLGSGYVVETSLRSCVENNRDNVDVRAAIREAVRKVGASFVVGGGASPLVAIEAFRPPVVTLTARGRAELEARGVTGPAVFAACLRATDECPFVVYQAGRRVHVFAVEAFHASCLACGRALGESGRCLPCSVDGAPVTP